MKLSKVRQEIAEEFLAALQRDEIPWHKEWVSSTMPVNAISQKPYRGLNSFILLVKSAAKNYSDSRWCTFNQAKTKGWSIKKGEKGTRIEFWSNYDKESKKILSSKDLKKLMDELTPEELAMRVILIARAYTVFNAEQIDGIPDREVVNRPWLEKSEAEILELRNTLLGNMKLELREGGNQAFYRPADDYVKMPFITDFVGAYEYMSVLLHECAHATSAPQRLDRKVERDGFGSEGYAKEELRAEIASAFTSVTTGIKYEQSKHMENHAAYVQNWIKVLKNEPQELFKAIQDAEKISDYLIEKGGFIVDEPMADNEDNDEMIELDSVFKKEDTQC